MNSSLMTFAPPEKQLLVCCARTCVTDETAAQIRARVSSALDWDYLLSEADENSLTPLLSRNLFACAGDAMPAADRERLETAARASNARCLLLTAELLRLLDALSAHRIQAMPYKGPVLAAQAYGDAALRQFDDLDLILRHRDLVTADAALRDYGLSPKHPGMIDAAASSGLVPVEYTYVDRGRGILVELHTERTLRHFPKSPDLEILFARAVEFSLAGRSVKSFAAEDLLPMLCLHGAKDFWSRLSWVADISELIQSHSHLDWNATVTRAEEFGATRMLYVGLALASNLLDAPLPTDITQRVEKDTIANQIASEVARRLLAREYVALSAGASFSFRRRMVAGEFAGWRYATRLALLPSDDEWQAIKLPGALMPLYALLRPLRLLRKYGIAKNAPGS